MRKRYITPSAAVLGSPPLLTPDKFHNGADIAAFISSAGLPCHFVQAVNAPQLVTYHFSLADVMQLSKVKRTLAPLQAVLHQRIIQTGSDSAHFALQITKPQAQPVHFKTALLTQAFNQGNGSTALLGIDSGGHVLCLDIAKAPHILIAGATGSGKSVLLNTIITSLLFKATPASLRFLMIDPKQVELKQYAGLPHLTRRPVTSPQEAAQALEDVCTIMDRRYRQMSRRGQRNAGQGFNKIIVVIDELADLMLTSKKAVEHSIIRIAQLGRAAGIHLIVATQRPTVNVITGLIKANIPCRIALQTASQRDSVNILDHKGAESLTGRGDALLKLPDRVQEIRFQSAYCSDQDIKNTVEYWRKQKRRIF